MSWENTIKGHRPDYPDLDGDGDTDEPMVDALETVEQVESVKKEAFIMSWEKILKFGPSETPRRSWEPKKEKTEPEEPFEERKARAQKGFDDVVRAVYNRFEEGNPMRNIGLNQMMQFDQKLGQVKTVEELTELSKDLRHLLMMLLNNIFDEIGGVNVDDWLKQNGFTD